jgi:nicotinamide-nucleotide amidase
VTGARASLLPAELLDAARRVVEAHRAAGTTVALAESCTGGLVAAALTEIPGSSEVLDSGFVTYSNQAKVAMLGVSEEVIETFGAVSVATAWGMAQGALARSRGDVAVAITGIAGPAGGSERKPVGTVIFARARRGQNPKEIFADTRQFGDLGRGGVRIQAALCALELLMPPSSDPGP